MHAQSDYSAALGVGVNVPRSDLGSAARKQLLDRSTTILANVAKVYRGHVLDASGGNLSILFCSSEEAMQAACEMRRQVVGLAPQGAKPVTVTIGASTRLGTAMVLMLHASPGEIAADAEFKATLEAPTVIDDAAPFIASSPARRRTGNKPAATTSTPMPVEPTSAPANPTPAPTTRPTTDAVPTPLARVDTPVEQKTPVRQPKQAAATAPTPELPKAPATATPSASSTRPAPKSRMALTFQGKTIVVDDQQTQVIIGRGPGCQLQLTESHVSRVHAWVLKQRGQFVLIDSSSNGTFLRQGGGAEVKVSKSTQALSGRGDFSLGLSGSLGECNRIRYELLEGGADEARDVPATTPPASPTRPHGSKGS